ncbi:MAG TPA: septum formation initiator family protein [Actinomycetota bacterium]|nr:septum formation initiator family protein [Actinomycetota bacterium]
MRAAAVERGGRARDWGRRGSLTLRVAVLAAVVAVLLAYLTVPLRAYLAQRSELGQLEWEVQVLEGENRALREQVAQLHDPRYLEELARRCLGMVRPGEIAFVVVPEDGRPSPAPC